MRGWKTQRPPWYTRGLESQYIKMVEQYIYIYIYKIFLYCPTSPNLSPSLSSLPPPLPIPPFLPSRSLNPALQTRTTHLEPWVRAGQPNDSSFCTANRAPSFQHFLLQMFAVSCWSTDRVPVLSMRFEVEKRYEKEWMMWWRWCSCSFRLYFNGILHFLHTCYFMQLYTSYIMIHNENRIQITFSYL